MAENKGWISLYRSLLDKPIWQCSTPEQKTIFITILLLANHKEREWEWQGKPYKCKPGQFITSIPSLVERCGKGITTQKVRTALNKFKKYGFLTDESTNNGRLITIVNWELYQGIKNETNIQVNRQATGNQQADNRQVTPNNNVNNVNKNIYSDIFNHWNSKKIIVHRELTKEIEKAIEKYLKEYPREGIFKAIDIYSEILNSEYFFNHKWSLKDFLNRKNGISSFMEEGSNKVNYEVWKEKDTGNIYNERLKNRKKKTVL
ncbi:DNA replication protein DnaD [Clostridium tetani]|uniref:DNA replication protein DnaD n=1 Tax=Clostridium tetani TaxID=1513 RepID=UPI00100A4E43|nr:DNA replication protein DnaD [Clostridium tetani]RXM72220.1 DNA replication protein DnaD [Clostridium tetani]